MFLYESLSEVKCGFDISMNLQEMRIRNTLLIPKITVKLPISSAGRTETTPLLHSKLKVYFHIVKPGFVAVCTCDNPVTEDGVPKALSVQNAPI